MSITARVIAWTTRSSAKRFEKATLDPVVIQRERLLAIVRRNARTEYGRRHGFGAVESVADYQNRVPIVDYEAIREDMDRVINGTSNVLTAEDPLMFARTSGTTGEPKYIPVTPTCQDGAHKDVMRTWLHHAQIAHPKMFTRKVVSLVSPAIEGRTPCGLPFGSTSGHVYKNMPGIVRRAYSIPYPVFEITDYNAKYYVVMRIALEHDVRFLGTANPSSIIKMCEKANEYSDDIIRDIHDGRLSADLDMDGDIRALLQRGMKKNPKRARALERLRSGRQGLLVPGDYWPDLDIIGCWKAGTVGHYLDRFPRWFDPDSRRSVPVRDWGFLSSEARGSVPVSNEGSAGVLAVASNFYEFAPVDDVESAPDAPHTWRFLTVGDLAVGEEYYIFLTTTGGLYRYDINDVVRVDDYYNRTPQITFVRKGRGMTSLTGEKVSVNQIIDAFQATSRSVGVEPDHYKAEADPHESRYVFRVEFGGPVAEATPREFLESLERNLREINIEYRAKRESQRLGAPVLHVMRDGWYERIRAAQAAHGGRQFQAKTVVLEKRSASPLGDVIDTIELAEEGG